MLGGALLRKVLNVQVSDTTEAEFDSTVGHPKIKIKLLPWP